MRVWKAWRTYYPSMLFYICVQFGASYLTYEHRLWIYIKSILTPNHLITDFVLAFTNFVPMVLIYLFKYPYGAKRISQLLYILLWAAIFSLIEYTFHAAGFITYHHGWNLGWSALVWFCSFADLRIHHSQPHWAWVFCFMGTAFLIVYFGIPVTKFK